MQKAAIFGAAGAVGRVVAAELQKRNIPYRVVGRRRTELAAAFGSAGAEIHPADLADISSATDAARGCDTIIYSVGVPYDNFRLHPELMRNTIAAAAHAGTRRLVVISSVYSYGVPQTARVAETHPHLPDAFKGKMRKEQEQAALEAQRRGILESLVVHLPDFYGPSAENSLGNMILRSAAKNETANWLGPVDLPHEFIFVPDAAAPIVELAARPDCYGQEWNIGGAGTITGRDFITAAFRAAGYEPKWRSVSKLMLRVLGLFNPLMRELVEMYYLAETPVILDDTKLIRTLGGVHKTPYSEGVRKTP
jgi:nucleoside-diphosphate-sugar epimerase